MAPTSTALRWLGSRWALASLAVAAAAGGSGCGSDPEPPGYSGVGDPVVGFLREHADPLDSLAPDAPFDDLEPLRAYVDARQVVMLGEPDHGIVESGQAQLRLIAFLYHELGYTTYATEMGRAVCELVQRYLDSGDEAALEELDIFAYPSFANVEQTRSLFRGLRDLSEARPTGRQPLRVRGYDLDHGLLNARDFVLAYLDAAASAELQATLDPLVRCVDHSAACEADQHSALTELEAAEAELTAASSPEQYDDAHDVLRGLGETLHYALRQAAGDDSATQFREDVMMRRIDEVLVEAPAGVIVFGHDLHISQHLGQAPGWWTSVGEHLAATQGPEQIYGLAMVYYEGAHLERVGAGQFEPRPVAPAPANHLEWYLQRVSIERFLLDFGHASPADPGSSWLYSPIATRTNGSLTMPLVPVDHYDGALYLHTVTPTTPR